MSFFVGLSLTTCAWPLGSCLIVKITIVLPKVKFNSHNSHFLIRAFPCSN